jgi:UDP:flavonoid glycosyltransferase YjiC (YdhE family)
MHAFLFPLGSHGDVHPFVGLGRALQRRGHEVTVFTNAYFGPLIESAGLGFVAVGTVEDYQRCLGNPDLWHPTRALKAIFGDPLVPQLLEQQYEEITSRFVPGETVVAAGTLALGARIARETHPVPTMTVHLQPAVMRSVVDPSVLPVLNMRSWPLWLRRAFYWYADWGHIDPVIGPPVRSLRDKLGLPPVRRLFADWLHSPDGVLALFPRWYADAPDWPTPTHLTDFPLFDQSETTAVPPELQRFLDAGTPPILFTPGSGMRFGQPFFQAAAEACQRLGRRGLLLTRFSEQVPAQLPEGVVHLPFVPFSAVLPRSAALVHPGGIGTTAQGLRAGVPQLFMPLAHDQPDNADRVCRLGAGAMLPPARFRGPVVAKVLRRLLESADVRAACEKAAAQFTADDPLTDACDALEALARMSLPITVRAPDVS